MWYNTTYRQRKGLKGNGKMSIASELIDAVATLQTCGDACWYAKEDTCRCSCIGANHGILKVDGAERPSRTRRVKQDRFDLIAVIDGGIGADRAVEAITGLWAWDRREVAFNNKATKSQLNWDEVKNAGCRNPFLIWLNQDVEITACTECGNDLAIGNPKYPYDSDKAGRHNRCDRAIEKSAR